MGYEQIIHCLECDPVIAAVQKDGFEAALASPAQIIFHLSAELTAVSDIVEKVHEQGKYIFVHLDLAEGIGKDRAGIRYLAQCGVDGVISTKAQLIRYAKEQGLVTVQRFFALDSKGMESIGDMLKLANPHLMEIMPGVITKAIRQFSKGPIPVIAGGLIQTKNEVMDALGAGASAVSTGQQALWHL